MATSRPSPPIARQACDACRVRKRRCELPEPASFPKSPSLDQNGYTLDTEEESQQCRRCTDLNLPCTFLLPVAARGPRKKDRSLGGMRNSTPSASLPMIGSTSELQARRNPLIHVSHDSSDVGGDSRSPRDSNFMPEMNNDPLSGTQSSPQSAFSNHSIPPQLSRPFPTDSICSRPLLILIMNDYMDQIYPLIPIVHLPTFRQDLRNDKDLYDADFLGLIISLCAATVGIMPRKFNEYRNSPTPLRFVTRTEMINQCHAMVLGLREADYFDKINMSKWACSYLIQISFFQIGQHNRQRMVEVEAMQLARLLDFHRISSYEGLDCIQTQLRKKAFWLMFYGYVHSQLQHLRKERLVYLDGVTLTTINFQDLMPVEVDDEMIHENLIIPQPTNNLSLTTGFNIASRLFWASLVSVDSPDSPAAQDHNCNCVRSKMPDLQLKHLKERLHDLKYMLDGVPSEFQQWATGRDEADEAVEALDVSERRKRMIRRSQYESMRANIHVSHLWLQSIIVDQVESVQQCKPVSDAMSMDGVCPDPKSTWAGREDTCRQLLHVLHGILEIHLEANGHHLTYKVRDVALTLLACPFDSQHEVSKRAFEYLREFTNILSRLDGSETINTLSLQSWVDTGRRIETGGQI